MRFLFAFAMLAIVGTATSAVAPRRGTCRCARISASRRGGEAFADATGRAVVFWAGLPSCGPSLHGQQLYPESVVAPAMPGDTHECFA